MIAGRIRGKLRWIRDVPAMEKIGRMESLPFDARVERLGRLLPAKARREAIITLPSGGRVSLVEVRERLLNIFSWRGMSESRLKQLLEKQNRQFEQLRIAVELNKKGKTLTEIAKKINVTISTVTNWLSGNTLPKYISSKGLAAGQRSRKPVSVPANKHTEFAYVLGSLFGHAGTVAGISGGAEKVFHLQVVDKEFAKKLESHLREIFPNIRIGDRVRPPPAKGGKSNRYLVEVHSTNLARYLNLLTNYGRIIPLEFLKSTEARINFLKGIFDSHGTVRFMKYNNNTVPYIIVRTRDEQLANFVSRQLLNLGIKNKVLYFPSEGRRVITLTSAGTQKFKEIIGFSIRRKQKML